MWVRKIEDLRINEWSVKDLRHSASIKPFPNTSNRYWCKLWKIIHKGGMDRENRSKMVIISQKNGETCDRNTHTPGLTWNCLLSFSFNTLHYFHPDKPSWYCLTCLKKEKEKRKRININPEDLPVAKIDTCLSEHAIRSSVTVLCLSVSLQGQLANDDSNDKEEHTERKDAGA